MQLRNAGKILQKSAESKKIPAATLPSCASFSPFFLVAALQNNKELHEILNVTGMACSYTLTMAGCYLRGRARSERLCAALKGALRCYPQQRQGMVALSLRWAGEWLG